MSKQGDKETASASLLWRKSTASGGGNCVEVAFTEKAVFVRNSNTPSGPVISFSNSEWMAFLVSIRDG
jgi:hypothetical protein